VALRASRGERVTLGDAPYVTLSGTPALHSGHSAAS
jgi:hypothetical protein